MNVLFKRDLSSLSAKHKHFVGKDKIDILVFLIFLCVVLCSLQTFFGILYFLLLNITWLRIILSYHLITLSRWAHISCLLILWDSMINSLSVPVSIILIYLPPLTWLYLNHVFFSATYIPCFSQKKWINFYSDSNTMKFWVLCVFMYKYYDK